MTCHKCIYRFDKLTFLGWRSRCRRYQNARELVKCADYKEKA